MQVIATNAIRRADRLAIARAALSAVLLLLVGLLVGWLCLGTPLISAVQPQGRPTAAQTTVGIVAWAFAIVVPAGLLLIGVARVAATIDAVLSLRPGTVASRLAKSLGPDHLAASSFVLPGGRRIHELVLGPFGIAILGEVPPRA